MNPQASRTRYSRRAMIRTGVIGLGAAAFLAACSDDEDGGGASEADEMSAEMDDMSTGAMDDMSSGATDSMTTGAMDDMASGASDPMGASGAMGTEFPLIHGWYKDREVEYYDFGMTTPLTEGNSVLTAPIYVMVRGMDMGNSQPVEGQHNIVGVKPGDEAYSDLWQVMLVTVGDDYEADSVKSVSEIMSGGFEVTETDMFVNCPIVPEGSSFEGGEELVQGWYNGEPVYYPDFGANPPVAIPIWVLITGMDASGRPQAVEGQMNVIDSVPDDDGYSAFWRVNLVRVPEGYEANSVKSAAAIRDMQYVVEETDMVVNCPVTVF